MNASILIIDDDEELCTLLADFLALEDFSNALTGDILFTSFPNEGTNLSSTLFGVKIKDRNHFNQILQVMQDVGKIARVDNHTYIMNTGFIKMLPIMSTYDDDLQRMVLIDDYAFVSLDETVIDAIKQRRFDPDFSQSYLLPLDNQANYISLFGNKEYPQIASYADQFSIKDYSVNYNGNELKIHFNLTNKDKSSLKQLFALNQ